MEQSVRLHAPTQGFRKSDPDQWQFSNERFIRGRRDLLKDIHRRKTQPGGGRDLANVSGNAAIEVGLWRACAADSPAARA
jgi:hypothetical protein